VLLDSVTHEFRTPLTAIKASAETLLSDVQLEKPERRDLLMVINEEGDRLNRLIGEAAEVAQLDSHQLQFHFEPHQINEPVQAAMQITKQALQEHPLEVNLPSSLPAVRMDVERVTEVLVHLLENAGKYSLPSTAIHVSAELRDSEILTSVADHGAGIDEMEQDILSRTETAHGNSRHGNGTGHCQGNHRTTWREDRRNQPGGARFGVLLHSTRKMNMHQGAVMGLRLRLILCHRYTRPVEILTLFCLPSNKVLRT